MALNFVKFQRGSEEAYLNLKRTNRLESDALYFIYDKTKPADGGQLYLGDVLIGGVGSTVGTLALKDLTDIVQSNPMEDGMILQYVAGSQVWQATSIREAIENAIPENNLKVDSGNTNSASGETILQALTRIDPNPSEGDIIFIDGVPFIYDGTNWLNLLGTKLVSDISTLQNKVQTLETNLDNLQRSLNNVDQKIIDAIAAADHLTYQVVSSLPTITSTNVEELKNIIFMVKDNNSDSENDNYDEYLLVPNGQSWKYEKLGKWNSVGSLSDYVTTNTFNTTVGDLQSTINTLQSNINMIGQDLENHVLNSVYSAEVGSLTKLRTELGDNNITLVDEVLELDSRLRWHDLDGKE